MSLFGKKKENKEECAAPVCACNGACEAAEVKNTEDSNTCCKEAHDGICCIKVLGSGCKNCRALLENTRKAVADMGFNIEVEYITDLQVIMGYGVMSMPALVVNEKVVSMGKVYKPDEIEKLLHKLGF